MPVIRHLHAGILVAFLCLLVSCSSLGPEFDPPKVSFEGFQFLPSESGVPRFEFKLRLANPNVQSLDIAGISYSIKLLDRELLSGVTRDVPLIEGYTEEVVTLEAGLQMVQLLRLLASLGTTSEAKIAYRLSAKIDFNGFTPTQRLEETGLIDLSGR